MKNKYVYKIDKDKKRDYNKRYYDKNKVKRHNQYLIFKNLQIEYYTKYNNDISKIPYKYLKQKDKNKLKSLRFSLRNLFKRGVNNGK